MHIAKTKNIYSFKLEIEPKHGFISLTAQEWPWCVYQVFPVTPSDTFEEVVEEVKKAKGVVAVCDADHSFVLGFVCAGDQDGKYPERHVEVCGQESARRYLDATDDCDAQAAVWYHTNVVMRAAKN